MSHSYAQYSTSDFDNFDCLKISKLIYLIVVFVLRGYIVWLMSVSNLRDKVGVIQWIYPEPSLFYLSLLSGSLGLFVLVILSLRRPEAKLWIKNSWRYIRVILMSALIFDLAVNLIGYFYWQIQTLTWVIVNASVVILFGFLLFKNNRIQINIAEFPEKLPE
ncbi:DUF2919 family protein [Colwellia sp. 1_MG-2023]|uniref:DUF2919 family protein n=1 Tax=Colwellia sp. 1_MG-2023 TaxID=3062649 RepID=UPI0026E17C6D|nr:DUF2919 family protein [Colwellia sp. 1_MG-2023]MDO6447591.1 DUF2919 family protein [Colwellia sp. 1_MG-2023]